MTRYQLAKIVLWASKLRTQKRLQKVVYWLQSAGCPLKADYYLHHYGPYSDEVARLADEMVRVGLLEEEGEQVSGGKAFSYRLSSKAADEVTNLTRRASSSRSQ